MPQSFDMDQLRSHFSTPYIQTVAGWPHVDILRLDTMHPVISGNKIFKLWYFLEAALQRSPPAALTFGGAWSNHLAAASLACRILNLPVTGIVRGEKPATLSPTLSYCVSNNMHLHYVSRQDYSRLTKANSKIEIREHFGDHTIIPEGGFSPIGVRGAAQIARYIPPYYTHVAVAAGTATTTAGLLAAGLKSRLIVVSALKGLQLRDRLHQLQVFNHENHLLIDDAHFGGYAKKSPKLLGFMNAFYTQTQIPLDFIYTAKLMWALQKLREANFFDTRARILAIHTGGLQGNASLNGQLSFGPASGL